MTSQTMAPTKVAASTWGATLNNARQVYTAAVRPAITYEAAIQRTPKRTRMKGLGPAAKVMTIQNKRLCAAYKAINIKVLEAEAGFMPLDIYPDQTVLKSRTGPRCPEMINQAKEVIKKKLGNKRGRQLKSPPTARKDMWVMAHYRRGKDSKGSDGSSIWTTVPRIQKNTSTA